MARLIKDWQKSVGQRIAALRKSRKVSRADLAAAVDMGYQQLGKYERGEVSDPKAEVYLSIAQGLKVEPGVLLDGLDDAVAKTTLEAITDIMIKQLPEAEQVYARRVVKVLSDIDG